MILPPTDARAGAGEQSNRVDHAGQPDTSHRPAREQSNAFGPKGTAPPWAGKGRRAGVPNRVTRRMRDAVASALEMSAPAIARWLQEVGDRDPHAGLQFAVALARLIQPRPPKAAPEPPAEVIHGVNVATLAPPEPQTRTWTHDRYGLGAPTATPAPAPPVVPDPDGTPVVTISRPRPTPPPPRRDDGVDTVYNPL